jgi:hypothetical protein
MRFHTDSRCPSASVRLPLKNMNRNKKRPYAPPHPSTRNSKPISPDPRSISLRSALTLSSFFRTFFLRVFSRTFVKTVPPFAMTTRAIPSHSVLLRNPCYSACGPKYFQDRNQMHDQPTPCWRELCPTRKPEWNVDGIARSSIFATRLGLRCNSGSYGAPSIARQGISAFLTPHSDFNLPGLRQNCTMSESAKQCRNSAEMVQKHCSAWISTSKRVSQDPKSQTPYRRSEIPDLRCQTPDPKSQTPDSRPQIRDPKSETSGLLLLRHYVSLAYENP